jgi:hypothetical protein
VYAYRCFFLRTLDLH